MEEIRIIIGQDEYPESPRDGGELGQMVCWHGRHNLGDEHNYTVDEFKEGILTREDVIALPVYLYDHSGLTVRTYPFNCPWDSGQLGFIFCTFDEAREWLNLKRITKKSKAKVEALLKNEVEFYNQYLSGDIWNFKIESRHKCEACGNTEWKVIDSCGGFYGANPEENGMLDHIPSEHHAKMIKAYQEL